MRLLILSSFPDLPETHLYCGLARKGLQLEFVGELDEAREKLIREAGIPFSRLVFKRRINPAAVFALRKILKRGNYDVVYAANSRALTSVLFASKFGYPSLKHVTYRGTMGHLSWLDPASRLSHLNSRVSKIICVSHAVEEYLASLGLPRERLQTIYKGHNINWYAQFAQPDLGAFPIPNDAFLVGCTANMRPVKGVDILIEAAQLLPSDLPIHFLLVGEVRDEAVIKSIRSDEARKKIHFTGFRKDAAALMGACKVFVQPSRAREGLPKAAIEAMSQSVTPIVTRVGGMPELVLHEQSGLVVSPSNPQELADAIVRLYKNPELSAQLGQAAQARIREEFNLEKMVDRYQKMLESL